MDRTRDAAAASREIVEGLDDALSILKDAETGQRGYLLTGDEQYLKPYHRATSTAAAAIERLRSLTAGSLTLRRHFDDVAEAASAKLAELEQTVNLRRDAGFDAAVAVVKTDRGKLYMDRVRGGIAAMRAEEAATRARLTAASRAALRRTMLTFTLASGLALALLLGVHLLSERSRSQFDRHAAWLSTTLRSIGDAVIATDHDGRVSFLNPAAETLTGWTRDRAAGRPLDEIFRITNQFTGEAVESPVALVLREGIVVGLANHTLLTARDGTTRPIDDSAAPILAEDGRIQGVVLVFHDVSDKYAAEDSLRETRRSLKVAEDAHRLIIENVRDYAIFALDAEGRIRSWNAGAEHIFGYSAAEAIGRDFAMLFTDEDRQDDAPGGELRKAGQTGRADGERWHVRKDGSRFFASGALNAIQGGQTRSFTKVVQDITARKRAEDERGRLLAAAQAANRMKDDFLAILSHELRTPLNAIVGWAKMLRSGQLDADDMQEGLAVIERNSQAQTQLVEDLLDVSRINSGTLRLDIRRIDLADVIEAALAAVTPAATAKEIRILKVLDPQAAAITGDPARLQQVIWNLLSNAVKFTPKGGRVQLRLERVDSHVEIGVSDTGMGIPPAFLPHVFDRFRQADSSTTRRFGGLGLGLSIVKQLAELHGGTVRAHSPGEGQGATFTVALPIAAVRPDRPDAFEPRPGLPDAAEEPCLAGDIAGLKVLVVDDEPDARNLIGRVLAGCDAAVSLAASAAEALEQIERSQPDVIVSDIGMPGQDGYDLIRRVRARYSARQIPAAALTAFARMEDRKRALLAGFQGHITKPVDPVELTATIASLACRTGTSDQHQGG